MSAEIYQAVIRIFEWSASLIEKIPPTLWGAIVGGYLTMLGTSKRIDKEFANQRVLRNEDREMAMRKDIYLDAAAAFSSALQTLLNFCDLSLTDEAIASAYKTQAPTIAKITVIADKPLLQATTDFDTELTVLFLELGVRRQLLKNSQTLIANLDHQIAGFEKTRDGMVDIMRQNRLAGGANEAQMAAANHFFQFESGRITELLARKVELARVFQIEQIAFLKFAVSRHAAQTALILPILAAARKELNLPFDAADFEERMDASAAISAAAVDKLIADYTPAAAKEPKPPAAPDNPNSGEQV